MIVLTSAESRRRRSQRLERYVSLVSAPQALLPVRQVCAQMLKGAMEVSFHGPGRTAQRRRRFLRTPTFQDPQDHDVALTRSKLAQSPLRVGPKG